MYMIVVSHTRRDATTRYASTSSLSNPIGFSKSAIGLVMQMNYLFCLFLCLWWDWERPCCYSDTLRCRCGAIIRKWRICCFLLRQGQGYIAWATTFYYIRFNWLWSYTIWDNRHRPFHAIAFRVLMPILVSVIAPCGNRHGTAPFYYIFNLEVNIFCYFPVFFLHYKHYIKMPEN